MSIDKLSEINFNHGDLIGHFGDENEKIYLYSQYLLKQMNWSS